MGGKKIGEAISFPWEDGTPASMLRSDEWILPNAFAQGELIRTAYRLLNGELRLPGQAKTWTVPLCTLGSLGTLGPDRRDIHDGFELSDHTTPYPAFWSHKSKDVFTIAQSANMYLQSLAQPKPGRKLRLASSLWPLAGKVLIAERMWLATNSLAAIRLENEVLSNVWWPFRFGVPGLDESKASKALAIWLNSTLGFLIFLASREETRGPWIDFKKKALSRLPLLNVAQLSDNDLAYLADTYAEVSRRPLLPLRRITEDETRMELDRAIARVCELPDFQVLREMLSREPIISLAPL